MVRVHAMRESKPEAEREAPSRVSHFLHPPRPELAPALALALALSQKDSIVSTLHRGSGLTIVGRLPEHQDPTVYGKAISGRPTNS
jgi:hypothetical protein